MALREREPDIDRLLTDRPDAVVIGGWLRDLLVGATPQDIDIVLTAPEPYLIPNVMTDTNTFGGRKVILASGFRVDYWNAVSGCTALDVEFVRAWLPDLVAVAPLTCMQCAYYPLQDLLWVQDLEAIEAKLLVRTERSLRVGLSRDMQAYLPGKIASLEARGWSRAILE